MKAYKEIDDTILVKKIHGRVKPKIYAFKTNKIPGYLKVGDTQRTVEERLNEWKPYYEDLKKIGDWTAEIPEKDIYFRDHSVHRYLETHNKKRLERDTFPKAHYSIEFFDNTTKDDIEDAIKDIVSKSEEKIDYAYYSIYARTREEQHFKRHSKKWEPRKPLQTDAINRFINAYKKGRTNLLMYAVMRFGKSFTALCCAEKMKAKFVLIVSGKADVAVEWQQNVEQPQQFQSFVFLTTNDLKNDNNRISKEQKNNKTIVLFLTLQDLANRKKRFAELFGGTIIDLMIIDETHFAARAETLGKSILETKLPEDKHLEKLVKNSSNNEEELINIDCDEAQKELTKISKSLSVRVKMHLSGTPYRILLGTEFNEDDIISFCQYSDIIDEKRNWYKENISEIDSGNKEEWDNPYYGFPEMVRFAFNLNESAAIKLQELEDEGYTAKLSEIFKPKSTIKEQGNNDYQKFVHEKEILDFLYVIDGSKKDKNILSFLDNKRIKQAKLCHHIVMVLPYCASCNAMEALLTDNKFKNLCNYKIINISGIDRPSEFNTISKVKKAISDCEKNGDKTITLTVNRMLTGCTVPEWDTMIFLKDTSSPQDYDQAIFRLQSQYIVEHRENQGKIMKIDMKPQTLLVDFDPQRMFYLEGIKSRINNINTDNKGNDVSKKIIEGELTVSPIIQVNGNKLVEVETTDILKAISEYSTSRGITEAAYNIAVDTTLMKIPEICAVIDREFEITSGKGFSKQTYSSEENNAETDLVTSGSPNTENINNQNKISAETNEFRSGKNLTNVFKNKFRSYYRRILFYAFLCKPGKITNLKEVLTSLGDSDNMRIFQNLGLNKNFIKTLMLKMDGYASRSLDDKIFDLYRLSHEYDLQDNTEPIRRAATAIQKFGKITDSEVVTPKITADKMIGLISDKDFIRIFDTNGKFLDIASKMGEFAVAIYKRASQLGIPHEKIKNCIYSIPTSNLAYEFTRYIYSKLEININNISTSFNTYNLLDIKDKNNNIDYKKICLMLSKTQTFSKIRICDEPIKGDTVMKFNAVVGNPPYQISKGGTKNFDIWPYFISMGTKISDDSCFIHPARWIAPKKQMEPVKKMILHSGLQEFNLYEDSSVLFGSNIGIDGGVTITRFSKDYKGKIKYFNNDEFFSYYNSGENFFYNKFEKEAHTKVWKIFNSSIKHRVLGNIGSIGSSEYGYSKTKHIKYLQKSIDNIKDPIKIWANSGYGKGSRFSWNYISKSKIDKIPNEILATRKVMIDKKGHSIMSGKGNIINNMPAIIDKEAIASGDVLFILPEKDTLEDLSFIVNMFKTKTIRFLMSISQKDLYVRGFEQVPDYTNMMSTIQSSEINDSKLYEIFNFSEALVRHIEEHISPK